jgi:hypothetical protein
MLQWPLHCLCVHYLYSSRQLSNSNQLGKRGLRDNMFLELILLGACALLILRLLLKKPKGIYIKNLHNLYNL